MGLADWMTTISMYDDIERDERIDKMVYAIGHCGFTSIDNTIFEQLCNENGYSMSDFTQADIDEIQRRMG